jgi:tetratricopeptide (TPR) repeat protein
MKRFLVIIIGAVIIAGLGFTGGFLISQTQQGQQSKTDILARCAIVASEDIRGDTLRIRCGLDKDGIDGILSDALAEVGIQDLRGDESPDTATLQRAADRLGLTMEAMTALLRKTGTNNDTSQQSASTEPPVRTTLEMGIEDLSQPSAAAQRKGGKPPELLPERVALAVKPESSIPEREARQIAGECAAAAGGSMTIESIDIACGPNENEVQGLITRFVDEAGVTDIRAALSKDAEARSRFVTELGNALHLSDETVETLIRELEGVDASENELRARLSKSVRERMTLSLMLLKIGQTADLLHGRQSETAQAIVNGDLNKARAVLHETGEKIRPLADKLAPEQFPPLVASAQLAVDATRYQKERKYEQAALAYQQAADSIADRWPLIADALLLSSAYATQVAGVEQNNHRMMDLAAKLQLEAAGRYNEIAVDTGINAADTLRQSGEKRMGSAQLKRAIAILKRLEPQVDRTSDPSRYVALQSGIGSTLWRLGQRSTNNSLLLQAETFAKNALDTAETLNEPSTLADALVVWGNVQLELGARGGDLDRIDHAISAYKRASKAFDLDHELRGWLSARNNIGAAYDQKARIKKDPEILTEEIEIYRDTLRRLSREEHGDLWALVKSNLARALMSQGKQKNDSRLLRMAAQELEATLSYYKPETDSLAWAKTSQTLATVWSEIGITERNEDALQKAVSLVQNTIESYDPKVAPLPWAIAHFDLGKILFDWAELIPKTETYKASAAALSKARDVIAEETQPQVAASLALLEASALYHAALESNDTATLKDAEQAAKDALRIANGVKDKAPSAQLKDIAEGANHLISQINKK